MPEEPLRGAPAAGSDHLPSRALHSDILDFGCRVAVTEQKLYLSGASAVIGDLKLPTSVAGPVRVG